MNIAKYFSLVIAFGALFSGCLSLNNRGNPAPLLVPSVLPAAITPVAHNQGPIPTATPVSTASPNLSVCQTSGKSVLGTVNSLNNLNVADKNKATNAHLDTTMDPILAQLSSIEGILETTISDDFVNHIATYRHYLRTDLKKIIPVVTNLGIGDLPRPGTRIRLNQLAPGQGKTLLANKSQSVMVPIKPPSSIAVGNQKTLIVIADFTDQPAPETISKMTQIMFGDPSSNIHNTASDGTPIYGNPTNVSSAGGDPGESVNSVIYRMSEHQTWLTGQVVGHIGLPLSSNDNAACNSLTGTGSLGETVQKTLLSQGIHPSAYQKLIIVTNATSCPYCGVTSAINANIEDGQQISILHLPGSCGQSGPQSLHIIVHELGHAFGLLHSHSCSVMSSSCPSSNLNEYGDTSDFMGGPSVESYNAAQKERIGWFAPGGLQEITQNGSYTLAPYEDYATCLINPKAYKILESNVGDGNFWYYYLQFAQHIYADLFSVDTSYLPSFFKMMNYYTGILIHQMKSSDSNSSYILNTNPGLNGSSAGSSQDYWSAALQVGETFSDPLAPQGGIKIKLNAIRGSAQSNPGADFTVTFGN